MTVQASGRSIGVGSSTVISVRCEKLELLHIRDMLPALDLMTWY